MQNKVLHLYHKGEQTHSYLSVDGFEPDKITVCQFHGCHWYEHTVTTKKNQTIQQKVRYKDI